MLSIIMLALLAHPATNPNTMPAPAPVIVNVATVEYKDDKGTVHSSSSNAVETKVQTTVAMNIKR